MRILKNPLMKLTLVALVVGLANPALAEWKQTYDSQGNNVGMHFSSSGEVCGGSHQFPKGSGNMVSAVEGMCWGLQVASDMDGDGTAEDTNANRSRGRSFYGGNNSLESYNLLETLYLAGENMDNASERIENSRIFTSLDADDLPEWPPEFREGRTTSGEPILHGAETIVTRLGDCFKGGGDGVGASLEYRFHMLNFAESNNMVYGHCFIRNMSEYLKWGPHPEIMERVGATPNGQVWMGLQFTFAIVYGYIGTRDEGFAFYAPKGINAVVDTDGQEGTFSGPIPMFGHMMLRAPSHNGETMTLTGYNSNHSPGYGFTPTVDILAGSWTNEQSYRYGLGRNAESVLQGYINPWNNKPMYGWPGILEPEDERYYQWTWTRTSARNHYVFWSELHDFGPRDSTSADFVIMFVYPKNPPLVMKVGEFATMDDPVTQDQLSPFLDYAAVAEAVFGGGYILPETPAPPPLTIIPGSRQVTITWSDVNVHTPDAYYYFLQDNPELDPNQSYREYDFEGYRLYRSFVAGSDSHSEVIYECSKSAGNVSYYFIDKYGDDIPFGRLSNGKKVWYALVPYDYNYDPGEQEWFSLPTEESGKLWNRAGVRLYTVLPRSDASNFKPASLLGYSYVGPATVPDLFVELSGDGSGKLTEIPKFLQPQLEFEIEMVNNERLQQDQTAYVECTGLDVHGRWCRWLDPSRELSVVDGSGNVIFSAAPFDATEAAEVVLMDEATEDGISYALHVLYENVTYEWGDYGFTTLYTDFDYGTYTEGEVYPVHRKCAVGWGMQPDVEGYFRTGVFEVTWKAAGGGLSVDVTDNVRGTTIPFGQYLDDEVWGFMSGGMDGYMAFYNEIANGVPRADRENLMFETVAADNTEDVALYVNGTVFELREITAMPSAGTMFTLTYCFGEWNDDETVFTQVPEAPYLGDRWQVNIKAMSMDPEDADLTKIRAVPNPYFATSFLDLSPNNRRIEFVNLPDRCTIRIYTLSGNLVNVLNHIGANRHGWGNYTDWDRLDSNSQPKELTGYDNHGGSEPWGLRNRFGQTVASGLYFFHVTDLRGETHTGRFYIVN